MEDTYGSSNGSPGLEYISSNNIRIIESNLQVQVKGLERDFDGSALETSAICDNVREQILNHEDEHQLSKNQNNWRRIQIASQLMADICFFHGNIVRFELTKIINGLLDSEKYIRISKRLTNKANLDLKKEKYFTEEAQSRLLKLSEDDRSLEEETPGIEKRRDPKEQDKGTGTDIFEKGVETPQKEKDDVDISFTKGRLQTEIFLMDDQTSDALGNMTQIRAETSTAEISRLQNSPIISDVNLMPTTEAEISVKGPCTDHKTEEDIHQILEILEEQMIGKKLGDIDQPETLLESLHKNLEPIENEAENLLLEDEKTEKDANGLQTSDEWSLPSAEPIEQRKKKRSPLIIDPVMTIRHYAARALDLNSQIQIERVMVYEGPPMILKAFTAEHSMTTPGFRSSLFHGVRSSKLDALYERHLISEKKLPETLSVAQKRRSMDHQRERNSSKAQTIADIVEESRAREGMHSQPERSVLVDIPEKTLPENLEFSTVEIPRRESLVGVAMSRIMEPTIEPPDMERIPPPRPLQSPRMKNLQGKSLESDATPPWFFTPKQNPPSEKWRNFNHVTGRLEEYWKLCEVQSTEKTIFLREFLALEGSSNFADYLTVLRVVDKLSIQRKLLLRYENGDAVMKPFQVPYISEKQFGLRGKEPV